MVKTVAASDQTRNTDCFSRESLSKLSEIMYEQRVSSGSYLYWEGDPADKWYFIKSGRVRITKSSGDGKQIILYLFREGDMFGQVDPYHRSNHFFNAEALDDVTVGVIQQDDLEVLLWRYGDLAVEFMKWMGLMHRLTQAKFRDLIMFGKPGALCSLLIRLSNTYGEERHDRIVITQKFTNAELGDMIGATRECVNRLLGDLRKKNVITVEDGHIVILDPEYLRNVCHCENCPKSICRL